MWRLSVVKCSPLTPVSTFLYHPIPSVTWLTPVPSFSSLASTRAIHRSLILTSTPSLHQFIFIHHQFQLHFSPLISIPIHEPVWYVYCLYNFMSWMLVYHTLCRFLPLFYISFHHFLCISHCPHKAYLCIYLILLRFGNVIICWYVGLEGKIITLRFLMVVMYRTASFIFIFFLTNTLQFCHLSSNHFFWKFV